MFVMKQTQLIERVYKKLGFEKIKYNISTRPEKSIGSQENWDNAENQLKKVLSDNGKDFNILDGEGAFYGPKIEFTLEDSLGREWQCGTIQIDFNLPDRLDAEFVGEDGQKHIPVMIHRAVLGSFERFIGVLIENYSGKLPFWLAPMQVAVATIISDVDDYAEEVVQLLNNIDIRCKADTRNEKISYKVREHSAAKVPVILDLRKKRKI